MIYKRNSVRLDGTISRVERSWLEHMRSRVGKRQFENLFLLSPRLLREMELFTRRNSLVIVAHTLKDMAPMHCCCERCLKAHLLKKTKEFALDKGYEKVVERLFECDAGHEGYYLDKNKMFRV